MTGREGRRKKEEGGRHFKPHFAPYFGLKIK
jgi:hypothetical protein